MRKNLVLMTLAVAAGYSISLFNFPTYYFSLAYSLTSIIALAVSWDLMGGKLGYLSLGHAAFYGLGAYGCAIFADAFPRYALLGIIVGGSVASLLSPVIGFISLRLKTLYFAIATLTLTFVLQTVVYNIPATGGGFGINFPSSANMSLTMLYAISLTIMFATIIAYFVVSNSKFGLAITAIKDNEVAAEAIGINSISHKIRIFFLSSFFAGLVGSLYPIYLGYMTPDGAFSITVSLNALLAPLLGGIGTLAGCVIGSIFIVALQNALLLTIGGIVYLVIFGVILSAVVIALPSGIVVSLRKHFSHIRK